MAYQHYSYLIYIKRSGYRSKLGNGGDKRLFGGPGFENRRSHCNYHFLPHCLTGKFSFNLFEITRL